MIIDNFPDRTIQVEGKEYLYFGGTSYLGMASQRDFQKLLIKNISQWGTNYGSSRNSNIKLSVYKEFEQAFSNFIGVDATASVSSGMLAGKLVMKYLFKSATSFYHYPKTHPAIISPNSFPLFIDGKLNNRLYDKVEEKIVISADAVLSLEVKATNFDFLESIPRNKTITLVIDESHSLGVLGKRGSGILSDIAAKTSTRKVVVSSMGKAMGLSFGVVCGDSDFIEELKNEPDFISSSGTNPAFLATFLQSEDIYKSQRINLKSNLKFIHANLNPIYNFNKQYPVLYSKDSSLYSSLLSENMVISKFKYPTYEDYMNRIVFTANHKTKDLKKLIHTLNLNYGN